jgi:hypothetical protein
MWLHYNRIHYWHSPNEPSLYRKYNAIKTSPLLDLRLVSLLLVQMYSATSALTVTPYQLTQIAAFEYNLVWHVEATCSQFHFVVIFIRLTFLICFT